MDLDPDPGGPKTCGCGGSGSGSATLQKRNLVFLMCSWVQSPFHLEYPVQGCSVQPAPGLAVLRRPGERKGSTLGQETTRQVQYHTCEIETWEAKSEILFL
jgi:hypothetical protein